MHFCTQERYKGAWQTETTSPEGLFHWQWIKCSDALLREAMAAGCILQTLRLQEGDLCLASELCRSPPWGRNWVRLQQKAPSLHWSKTAQQFCVLNPNANKEPDACIWISLSHPGFVPCDCLRSVTLNYYLLNLGEFCGQEKAGSQLHGCAKGKASFRHLRKRMRKVVAQGESLLHFLSRCLEQNRLPSVPYLLSFAFSDNLGV